MSVLDILTIPAPELNKKSELIISINDDIKKLAMDMLETMHHYKSCVGLAAPQVGRNVSMIVVNVGLYHKPYPHHGEMILINPILKLAGERKIGREGCLSIPDLTANVFRASEIEVQASNLEGGSVKLNCTGFEAVVIQHETDHLEGVLFLDRVASLKTDVFRRKKY